jgi:transcriptional regulator with XRE-family HTH domain
MIGEYIRARRKTLGMSQQALGDAIGRDQQLISQIERNREPGYLPSIELLRALSRALHCSIEELLRAAGYLEETEDADAAEPDNERIFVTLIDLTDQLRVPSHLKTALREDISWVRRRWEQEVQGAAAQERRSGGGSSQIHHAPAAMTSEGQEAGEAHDAAGTYSEDSYRFIS